MGQFARPSLREDRGWSLRPQSLRASQRPHQSAHKLEREREEGDQIKRISSPESNSGEISESGINPENLELNSISSFGSRSEQISASRKPLFLDTTLCLKEPSQESMIAGQGQESCLHTPVWGVEGFNISTYKEVEEELTTGKQHTRVFNGLNNHNVEENSNDTAMINTTINFDDLLLGDTIGQSSTSTAPTMDLMIEEENQNLTIERNTVPLLEDTTNIMEKVEVEATKATKRSRMKMEELTEEEKYRRMREQNNRASQACRAKRKRKLVEEEEELNTLQQKNIQLQAVLNDMEKEVASYKKRILEQVSGVRN